MQSGLHFLKYKHNVSSIVLQIGNYDSGNIQTGWSDASDFEANDQFLCEF
jgi:hypothetical protein